MKSGLDEINLIENGNNYGWPIIQGDEQQSGMEKPIVHSGPDTTWAPGGMTYFENKLFFAGLRGESLYAFDVTAQGNHGEVQSYFVGKFGRLRTVSVGPEGELYLLTSSTDGRGVPRENDDKLIRIDDLSLVDKK